MARSSMTYAPWPTRWRTSPILTVGRPWATRTAFSAPIRSGAVSTSVPSRSKTSAGEVMEGAGRGNLTRQYTVANRHFAAIRGQVIGSIGIETEHGRTSRHNFGGGAGHADEIREAESNA